MYPHISTLAHRYTDFRTSLMCAAFLNLDITHLDSSAPLISAFGHDTLREMAVKVGFVDLGTDEGFSNLRVLQEDVGGLFLIRRAMFFWSVFKSISIINLPRSRKSTRINLKNNTRFDFLSAAA